MSWWSDTDYDWEVKALPAGIRVWAQAYAGVMVNKEGRFMRADANDPTNPIYLSEVKSTALEASEDNSNPLVEDADWTPRSFLHAIDEARGVANLTINEKPWWSYVNYENAMNENVTTFLEAARKILSDRKELILSADFGSLDESFEDGWYNPSEQSVDVSGYTVPSVSVSTQDLMNFNPIGYSTMWPGSTPFEASTTTWDHPEVFEVLRDFAYQLIDNLEMDSMVERYRLALEADYEARVQRNAAMLFLAGAASTSPAALSAYRMSSEIERMVAAYRADILRAILPDTHAIASVFGAFVQDSSRIDSFKLNKAQQILQARMSAIDKAIVTAVADAGNETNVLTQNMAAKVNLAIAALDARLKISVAAESARLDVLRIITALDQALAELQLKQAAAAQAARQEWQVNQMKVAMWKIELAESLMNSATIPLGVQMAAPEPSKFETRLSAGISTGINMATALAGFGNPALSIGVGLVGGLITGFLPSLSD